MGKNIAAFSVCFWAYVLPDRYAPIRQFVMIWFSRLKGQNRESINVEKSEKRKSRGGGAAGQRFRRLHHFWAALPCPSPRPDKKNYERKSWPNTQSKTRTQKMQTPFQNGELEKKKSDLSVGVWMYCVTQSQLERKVQKWKSSIR